MFEHKHPLDLIDLWSEQLEYEEQYEEDTEDEEDRNDSFPKQDFRCLCFRCDKEINWLHRYYYTCCQCAYSIHKFCAELPERVEGLCKVGHILYFYEDDEFVWWGCDHCHIDGEPQKLRYHCSECYFNVHVSCVTERLLKNIIHHPSHIHPLVSITKQILSECDACGKKHKGIFYRCTMCSLSFIHNDCAFLPKQLKIQHTTNDIFFHTHPLILAYSFPYEDQESKFNPRCRVCKEGFHHPNLWIYKCEKCRYYTHLDCATSMPHDTHKIVKNYEDVDHPDLLHLPFPDLSYSILKHLFFKEDGSSILKTNEFTKTHISHQHPLILEDTRCTDVARMKSISYHNPMKRIELLCNGCLRPITTTPIYMCSNEDDHCNFVLHEWCSQLPTELFNHFDHPQHTLILHSKTPSKFFGVFDCNICELPCNGFVYCCEECKYYIDVNCAFLPKVITHNSHPDHLLSRVYVKDVISDYTCSMCGFYFFSEQFSFSCKNCDFHIHPECALLIPEITTHKCDKHPMKLSYFPVENHKGEYYCEICEEEFDPEFPFYHCHECMQSMHPACAPSILRYETHSTGRWTNLTNVRAINRFVNVKFGGTYKNFEIHPHPLSFMQGIASDGKCIKCGEELQYTMVFKCVDCKFAIYFKCCEDMST